MAERKIIWTAKAAFDLQRIVEYWVDKTGNSQYSSKLFKLVNKSVLTLKVFPNTGRVSDFDDVRVKPVLNYLIFYQTTPKEIRILRVWDSRRNPDKLKI
ncbi:type II toxin-antitoxin system RelE/ParE family toxin [Reichenbachiella sp. MSK19-1]|uniref:type II toxin-antitoxin system RelE/ParE family toxin n=1 Tax=Reichenbachiella sp. MSK19-1 TaxID=1897631 RepID=UPI000E6C965C|nr:type II toxin-antitoxin system RelE/ParE family toxin [Reichenbachiella sp. MSK19-1]RJE71828.1 hypothetical protein BGP76_06995 [Reichenbachiella sp. MSK19-1]